MAKSKKSNTKNSTKKRSVKTSSNKQSFQQSSAIVSATAIIFTGVCVVLLGNIQLNESLKLLLVGFGAAMLVFGGVILAMAIKTYKS